MAKKNQVTCLCSSIKPSSTGCGEPIKQMGLLERIERAKKNIYMKDTWQDIKVTFVDSGLTITYGEIDKVLNN